MKCDHRVVVAVREEGFREKAASMLVVTLSQEGRGKKGSYLAIYSWKEHPLCAPSRKKKPRASENTPVFRTAGKRGRGLPFPRMTGRGLHYTAGSTKKRESLSQKSALYFLKTCRGAKSPLLMEVCTFPLQGEKGGRSEGKRDVLVPEERGEERILLRKGSGVWRRKKSLKSQIAKNKKKESFPISARRVLYLDV